MRERRLKSEINVVPYIDVMLVLLVIFMVTAPLINTGTINLPTASTSNTVDPKTPPLQVNVAPGDKLSVKGLTARQDAARTVANMDELKKIIQEAITRNPQRPVLIAGDKEVVYAKVLAVMDELRKARVQRVGLLVNTR